MDQAPPFRAVYQYMIIAPLFLSAAGFLIASSSDTLFYNFAGARLIAILHLVTIGFILQNIFGVLKQMMPVIGGVVIKRPVLLMSIVTALFLPGALLFPLYFLQLAGDAAWIGAISEKVVLICLLLLGLSLVIYAVVFLAAIAQRYLFNQNVGLSSPTVIAMILALLSMIALTAFGFLMGYGRLMGDYLATQPAMILLHLGWAFAGLILILIIGVSFRVIPMFFVAPDYPRRLQVTLAPTLFGLLLLYSFSALLPQQLASFFQTYGPRLIGVPAFLYGVITLVNIAQKRRALPDYTLYFWGLSMVSLLLAVLTLFDVFPIGPLQKPVLFGMFFILGFAVTLIMGMLYKIVPFLSWFHLASKGVFEIPSVKNLISDRAVMIQFVLQTLAISSLLVSIFQGTPFIQLGGAFLAASGLFLFFQLTGSVLMYRKIEKKRLAAGDAFP